MNLKDSEHLRSGLAHLEFRFSLSCPDINFKGLFERLSLACNHNSSNILGGTNLLPDLFSVSIASSNSK